MCDEAAATYDIAVQANIETTSPAVKSFVSKYSSHATPATMTIDKNENEGSIGPRLRSSLLKGSIGSYDATRPHCGLLLTGILYCSPRVTMKTIV
jgi:hypothetical protein